jgi:YesN/AraC family two-component response regulator
VWRSGYWFCNNNKTTAKLQQHQQYQQPQHFHCRALLVWEAAIGFATTTNAQQHQSTSAQKQQQQHQHSHNDTEKTTRTTTRTYHSIMSLFLPHALPFIHCLLPSAYMHTVNYILMIRNRPL